MQAPSDSLPSSPTVGSDSPGAIRDTSASFPELDQAMDRYAQGDERAFAQVFSGLSPRLRTFLRRLCGSPELAEDLVQETFLRIHRARGSFASGAAALPWAYAIARNCYIDQARAAKVRPQPLSVSSEESSSDPLAQAPSVQSSAEEETIARQTAYAIERALANMSVARREAFILLRYEGLSIAEAAQVLGATEGAVKLRAFHAYEAIRQALAQLESDGET